MKINKVLIYGCGLVGGSLALLFRNYHPHLIIHGVSRSQDSIVEACELGVIDRGGTSINDMDHQYDLVIVSTPIEVTPEAISDISNHLNGPCIITDVASVKGYVKETLPPVKDGQVVILGHPMAGSHHTGVRYASSDIMENAHYILVPSPADAYLSLKDFLATCQFRLLEMSAAEHDLRASYASHIPYLMACMTTDLYLQLPTSTQAQVAPVLAKGFSDSTRVAGSDPTWGVDICLKNTENIMASLETIKQRITELQGHIQTKNHAELQLFFDKVSQFKQSQTNKNNT